MVSRILVDAIAIADVRTPAWGTERLHIMWDHDVDECEELGHEYDEGIDLDLTGEPIVVQHCTWCGIAREG